MGARMCRYDLTWDIKWDRGYKIYFEWRKQRNYFFSRYFFELVKGCWDWIIELFERVTGDEDAFESMVDRRLSTLRTKKLASSCERAALSA